MTDNTPQQLIEEVRSGDFEDRAWMIDVIDRLVAALAASEPDAGLVEGVWAILDDDYISYITAVYPTELDALRVINRRGYGRVAFLKWGHTANGEPVETS